MSFELIFTTTLVFSILVSFLLSFPIIALLYRLDLTRKGDVDFSNLIEERKKKVGTPIMGGLIIIISVLLLNLIFNKDPDNSISGSIKMPLLVFGFSALLGGLDDILNIYGKPRKVKKIHRTLKLIKVHKNFFKRLWYIITFPWIIYKRAFNILGSNPGKGIHAHEKIIIQTGIGILIALWIYYLTGWDNPSSLLIPILGWFDIGIFIFPLIIFASISFSNAVNLSDGMDGLSSGMLLFAFSGFLVISILQNNTHMTILILSIIGSLITYLYFNIPPARFQMGDIGSLALGTILTAIAFELRAPLFLLIIGFPFVAEVATSLVQSFSRRLFGRRIFLMAPLHHHLEMKGWNEEKVVMRFWIISLVFSVLGVWIYVFTISI